MHQAAGRLVGVRSNIAPHTHRDTNIHTHSWLCNKLHPCFYLIASAGTALHYELVIKCMETKM